jgi:hypothetical protein
MLAVMCGVFLTIVVAIACAMFVDISLANRNSGVMQGMPRGSMLWSASTSGAERYIISISGFKTLPDEIIQGFTINSDEVPSWCDVPTLAERSVLADQPLVTVRDARGWPWPAFWGCPNQYGTGLQPRGCILLQSSSNRSFENGMKIRSIPILPVWSGLALNVIFYSSIIFLLMAVARSAIRLRRRLGGRCVACNYNLRGLNVSGCPECGWNRSAAIGPAGR